MRRVALVFLTTALWSWSMDQAWAQGRMGGQCAGHSASSSSSLSMNSSPGFSAFTGNGSTLNNGASFGLGTSSMMGGGFGSNLNFATANGMAGGFNPYQSANAFAQGGNGLDSFDTGFGMGAMNGQSYAQVGHGRKQRLRQRHDRLRYGHDPAHKLHGQLQPACRYPSDENEIQVEVEEHREQVALREKAEAPGLIPSPATPIA